MKKCYLCMEMKSDEDFYKDIRAKDGLSSKCKPCARSYVPKNKKYVESKECSDCGIWKPAKEFYKNSRKTTGLQSECKSCHGASNAKWNRDSRTNIASRRRTNFMSQKYGLSQEDYQGMLEEQDNRCKICEREVVLVVDHCHSSGKVRGLLCNHCNTGLGMFKDNIESLRAAIKYLEDNNGSTS